MFSSRDIPERIEDRLIVALDVPNIKEARALIDKLDAIVSFFKIGLWLAFAAGFDELIDDLLRRDKKIFLDTKMFDIGETVKQGVARAAERGVSFVTVHGDDHKRAGTPAEAIAAGADYLVVGRPIIRSDDPAAAASRIIDNMRSAVN